ncbi:unnamed protein product [Spirodela intermedia]|uniref:RING-type E3 ubiquitin transferase n=2 Tax=Spirodela intermedia TaxID=51605 RepID=A0A7I8IZ41_SPIIN|nr:unnamed protein product [Spirodela intermedia]CAA6662982.1 unnamed protein product [Spirodela intermedia]CAA7399408.1 unnamed protein product [Spirodela intermedia]
MEDGMMESYRYMDRTFSESSANSSGAFSDFGSERSGEFALNSQIAHRIIASTAAESNCSEGLERSLVADLESDSVEAQRRAAMEIRLLTKCNADNRLRFVREGAVRPLVSLMSSTDPQIQEHSVTAILNLSLRDENRDAIAAAGAIKPLVRALKFGTAAAKENAAFALLRLSHIEDHKVAIGRSGAIPLLVNLLETGTLRGKKDALATLYTLCSARENEVRAVQAGIMKPLLELMADPDSGMVDKAAFVMNILVVSGEARAAVVAEGGIPVLVEIVEVGLEKQKEMAASVLLQICEESVAYRSMVAREGAIPPLIALSQAGTTKARKKAEALIGLLRLARAGNSRWTAADGPD